MNKPKRKLGRQELFEFAVKSLAKRAQSTAEMRRKLHDRADDPGDVDEALARLREYGYLDEKRFAEQLATLRLENSGFGRTRTLFDLRARRVAPTLAAEAVDKAYLDTDEDRLIEDFVRRKYRTAPRAGLFEEEKDLASAYRRLLRAGFRSAAIVRVLKRFAKNPDLLDAIEDEPNETPG